MRQTSENQIVLKNGTTKARLPEIRRQRPFCLAVYGVCGPLNSVQQSASWRRRPDQIVRRRGSGRQADRHGSVGGQPPGGRRPRPSRRPAGGGSPRPRRGNPGRRCERSAGTRRRCARGCSVAAVVAADDDHQVDRPSGAARRPRPADPAWRCKSCRRPESARPAPSVAVPLEHRRSQHLADRQRLGHQHRRLVGEADALQVAIGIEARRGGRREPLQKRVAIAAVPDVIAHHLRLRARSNTTR